MIIREVQAKDSHILRILDQNIGGKKNAYLSSKRQDYFYRANKFLDPILLVAEDDNKVLASIGLATSLVKLKERTFKASYIFDLACQKDHKEALLNLWSTVKVHIEEQGVSFIYGYLYESNSDLLEILPELGASIKGKKNQLVIPLEKKFISNTKNTVLKKDLQAKEEYKYLTKKFGQLDLFPVYTDMELVQNIYDQYLYGKIILNNSSLKIWQAPISYYYQPQYHKKQSKCPEAVRKTVSSFFGHRQQPTKNKKIKIWHILDLVLAQRSDLFPMLEKVRREAKQNAVSALFFYLDDKDNRKNRLLGWSSLKLDFNLFLIPMRDLPDLRKLTYFDHSYL